MRNELYTSNVKLTSSKATGIHFLYSYKRGAALPVCVCVRASVCERHRSRLYIGLSTVAVVLSLAFYGVVWHVNCCRCCLAAYLLFLYRVPLVSRGLVSKNVERDRSVGGQRGERPVSSKTLMCRDVELVMDGQCYIETICEVTLNWRAWLRRDSVI